MTNDPKDRDAQRVEELAEDAKAENPDRDTRRESFELDLMEEGRSKQGESTELDDDGTKAP